MPADAAPERSARHSKGHPKYARTYTLLNQALPGRVLISRHARPFERFPVSLCANGILLNNFRLIWVIQSSAQKYSAFPHPQSVAFSAPSRLDKRGGSRVVTCSCAQLFTPLHTRPRVQQAPAFPARSVLRERTFSKPRAQCTARTRTHTRLSSSAKAGDPVFQRQQ
jgi:hypothetical protein